MSIRVVDLTMDWYSSSSSVRMAEEYVAPLLPDRDETNPPESLYDLLAGQYRKFLRQLSESACRPLASPRPRTPLIRVRRLP